MNIIVASQARKPFKTLRFKCLLFLYHVQKNEQIFLDFTKNRNSWKSQCYIFKWNLVTFLIFLEGHREWMTLLFGICLAVYFASVLDASGILQCVI